MLETLIPARYFFPFVQRFPSIHYIVPFVSALPVHLMLPLFRFNASILFMYFFLSFQAVQVVASFHSCQFLYYTVLSLPCLFYCNSSISLVALFLWFQRSPPRWLLLPFVLPLTVRLFLELFRCISFLSFVKILPSFLSNSSLSSGRSFRFNSFFSFVPAFLSFQLSPVICYFLQFASTLSFYSFLPSVRFKTLKSRSLLLLFVSSRLFRFICPYVSPL